MLWVAANEGVMDDIILGINVDDAGRSGQGTHVSFYGVPDEQVASIQAAMATRDRFEEGPQWFQSDHAILAMSGRPAIAIAESDMAEFMSRYAHTAGDVYELVDCEMVAEISRFMREVVIGLGA